MHTIFAARTCASTGARVLSDAEDVVLRSKVLVGVMICIIYFACRVSYVRGAQFRAFFDRALRLSISRSHPSPPQGLGGSHVV